MAGIFLQRMVENLPSGVLPPNWAGFDLASFSRGKNLFDYQQTALQNALLALWKYYDDNQVDQGEDAVTARDDQPAQDEKSTTAKRNQDYLQWYKDFGLKQDLSLPLDRSSAAKRKLAALLETYYEVEDEALPYEQFINRMSFWMATGSGKTLVIVKMLELLDGLIKLNEIPSRDILVLAHRDDLLEQLRIHVEEFNKKGGLYIHLKELKEYAEIKRSSPSLFVGQEVTVFYYRSDNLSDEQKDKIIDFRNYDNDGKWYILLDEAHKGDKEDSKRQHIYSIMSRNGFLFNFSATFTDDRDIITTVANFNLSEFVRKGHGKHISILRQEARAFKKGDEYTDAEKQKIVLKALIMLAYARQVEAKVRKSGQNLYHRPLLMTLVNSVNTEDADLKLFFRELVRIGNGGINKTTWESAKKELRDELRERPVYLYETERASFDDGILAALTQADLLRTVFNSPSKGQIEVLVRPSNRQEVAFKLKTSDDPFALVRIGDISDWIKQELAGYEINQRFADEGYFESLNHPDSDINILLGSRSFYEGWDSNRPNVIMYINIGTGTDAKKFILQSVGRGVRIEPIKNQRKRLRELRASGVLDDDKLFYAIKDHVETLESVFIFGTNREALNLVINELDQEENQTGEHEIALELNEEMVEGKVLLVPTYQAGDLLHKQREQAKLTLNPESAASLKSYLDYMRDADRILLAIHETSPAQISALRDYVSNNRVNNSADARPHRNLSVMMKHAFNYFTVYGKNFKDFKPLEDEIRHFRQIKVRLEDITELRKRIGQVLNSAAAIKKATLQLNAGRITPQEFAEEVSANPSSERFFANNSTLEIRRIANHYYVPVLLSDDQKIDFIRSVIHVESEVRFLRELEEYIKSSNQNNLFKKFDWWLFSRVDEKTDDITIPYYSPFDNKVYNFKPDFVFWLQKGNRYHILFVDPKGTSRNEYQHKVDGFRLLFEKNDKPRIFNHDGLKVSVHLFLYTQDTQFVADYYRRYWRDNIQDMLSRISQ